MKERTKGFLSEKNISHDSEIFDYIAELHGYLWRVVRVVYPEISGLLDNYIDKAVEKLEQDTRLSDLQAVASKLAFALRGHDALPDDNEALSAYEKLMEQK